MKIHVQYINKVEDYIDRVEGIAQVILGVMDEEGAPVVQPNKPSSKELLRFS